MNKSLAYFVPITPEAFLQKLEAESKRDSLLWQLRNFPVGTVLRRVRGNRFALRAPWRTNMMNSFEPVFRGKFETCEGGTLIKGHLGPHRGIRTFFRVWVAFCIGFMGLSAWAVFRETESAATFDWSIVSLPVVALVLLASMLVLRRAGREMGESQAKMLMDFLHARLGLTECDDTRPSGLRRPPA